MTTISLKDAQAKLAETVKRTESGPIVLQDSGQPVAIVLSVEEYHRGELRELTDQDWQALIDGERKFPHDPQSLALPPKGRDD